MSEVIADLVVKADWDGGKAERGLSNIDKGIKNVAASAPRLTAVDRAASGIGSSFSRIHSPLTRVTSGMGGLVTAALPLVAVGATVGLLGASLASTVGKAATFQQKMSAIKSTSGATDEELQALKNTALQLGAATDVGAVSAADAADAIFELGKAGLSIEKINQGAAKATLQLAAAAGPEFGVANAASLAADAMNAFGKSNLTAERTANVLVGAANASSIGLNDLKFSLAAAGAVANLAGLSFEDTAVAIAVLGQNGLKAADAGTSLKTLLGNLQPSTAKQTALFRELGLITKDGSNQFYDATGKIKGMADISGVLAGALKGQTDMQKQSNLEILFGSDAIRAGAILAQEGAEGINEMAAAMKKQGDAAKVAGEMSNNLSGKWEALRGTVETLQIKVGEFLIPELSKLADIGNEKVSGILAWLDTPDTQANIGRIGDALKSGLAAGWDAISRSATWVWQNVLKPAFEFFTRADIKSAILDGIAAGWKNLSDIGTSIWTNGIKPFGEWLAKPETAAKLGEIGGFIGGTLANGAKFAADNIGLIVAGFVAWNIANKVKDLSDLAITLATKVVPALWSTAAAQGAVTAAGGPGGKVGLPGGLPLPGGAAAAGGLTPLGAVVVPVALTLVGAGIFAFDVKAVLDVIQESSDIAVKLHPEMKDPTQFVAGIESAVKLLPVTVPVTVKPSALDINEWGDVKLPPKDFAANPKLIPPEGGWDKFRGEVTAGVGPVPISIKVPPVSTKLQAAIDAEGQTARVPVAFDWGENRETGLGGLGAKLKSMGIIKVPVELEIAKSGKGGMGDGGIMGDLGVGSEFWKGILPTPAQTKIAAQAVGTAVPAGVATGIATGTPTAKAAATAMSTAVTSACNTAWEVKSPSRVFMAIGANLITGLVQGMVRGGAAAVGAARTIAASVVNALRAAAGPGVFQTIGLAAGAGFARGIGIGMNAAVGVAQAAANRIIAVTKAALAIKSPSQVFQEIGNLMMKGWGLGIGKGTPEVVKQMADAAQSIVNVVSSSFDLLSKIGSGDTTMPDKSMVDNLFLSLDYMVVAMKHRLGVWKGNFDEEATKLAGYVGSSVASVGQALDPLAKIGDPDFVAPTHDRIKEFWRSMDYMVVSMRQRLGVWKDSFTEETTKLAGYVGDSIASVGKAIDPLAKIADPDFVAPSHERVLEFWRSMDYMVVSMKKRLDVWKGHFSEETTKLAAYVGDSIASVGKAIEPLTKLGNPDLVLPGRLALEAFFSSLDIMVPMISERTADWWTRFDAELVKVAGFIGDAVAGVGKAIEPLMKLGNPDMVMPGHDALRRFFDSFDLIIPMISERTADWWTRFDAELSKVAGYMGDAVAGVLKAVEPLSKLGNPDLSFASHDALRRFFDSLDLVVPMISERTSDWWTRFDVELVKVAGFIGDAVVGTLKAIEPLSKLGNPDVLMPTQGALDRFFTALDLVIPMIHSRAADWWTRFDKELVDVAGFIGQAVTGTLAALDPLVKLGSPDLVMPTQVGINKFFDALDLIVPMVSSRAADWWTRFDADLVKVAGWIGQAVSGIGQAIEPLSKIAQIKDLPTGEQIDAFFWKLEDWLNQFNKRAEVWARIATEQTAKLAGWVGDIASGIGKAFDPLLKMGEVQKVTPEQIEGSMANVWTALHHFNRVMTGGSEGTPFEGAWMDRAKVFASGLSELFAAIQTAMGALGTASPSGDGGVTGFSQVIDTLRIQWNSIFGPRDLSGTLLHSVFGPEGFTASYGKFMAAWFTSQDESVPKKMAWHRLVWTGEIDIMGTSIVAKLDEILPVITEKGDAVGQAIASGVAAGITAGTHFITEAAEAAVEAAIDAAKKAAGIKSPSRLAASEIGMPLAQGVAVGIDAGAGQAAESMRRLVGQVAGVNGGAVIGGVSTSTSDRYITGAAATRSINPEAVRGSSSGDGKMYGDGSLVINGSVVLQDADLVKTLRDALYRQGSRSPGVEFGAVGA